MSLGHSLKAMFQALSVQKNERSRSNSFVNFLLFLRVKNFCPNLIVFLFHFLYCSIPFSITVNQVQVVIIVVVKIEKEYDTHKW